MSRCAGLLVAIAALLLAACAGAPPAAPPGAAVPAPLPGAAAPPPLPDAAPPPPPPRTIPFTTLAARFTSRALQQERAGELRQALGSWKVVAALRPAAADPKRRIAALSARLQAAAERHYRNGLKRLKAGATDAARRDLLLALAADPDHAAALDALKNRIAPDAVAHTVAAGESFESIARKQYGDPGQAALVALVNELDPAGRPEPGTVLQLPVLARPAAQPAAGRGRDTEPDAAYETAPAALGRDEAPSGPEPGEELLTKAEGLLQAGKFEESAATAEKLAGHAVLGNRARELAGNAWFSAGEAAFKEERFAEAIAAYRKAEPAHRGVPAAIAAVERRKREKAEALYNAGVNFFINQRLEEAIRSWEQTLALNPEHPNASKDIEKARGLQQKLKELR